MDPDALLARLRLLALSAEKSRNDDVRGLAEGFKDLDEWLSRGGFVPRDWSRAERRHPPTEGDASPS